MGFSGSKMRSQMQFNFQDIFRVHPEKGPVFEVLNLIYGNFGNFAVGGISSFVR